MYAALRAPVLGAGAAAAKRRLLMTAGAAVVPMGAAGHAHSSAQNCSGAGREAGQHALRGLVHGVLDA